MTKDEVKKKIVEICNKINAPVGVVMAIAGIESNFNPSAKSRSGTYQGIFQLSNGWGGCIGDERLDLEKSIRCLWNNHSTFKDRWKQISNIWDDFFYYGIHQMGYAGFVDIYKNRNKLLSEISEARCNNILSNKPKNIEWVRVSDWWNYFERRFYSIYNEHSSLLISLKKKMFENKNYVIVGSIFALIILGFITSRN